MPELKLAKLPDRTPVKIMITVTPELNRMLQAYAELYRERYGETETISVLIPAMIERFLKSDTRFIKAWKERGRDSIAPRTQPVPLAAPPRRREVAEPSPTSS